MAMNIITLDENNQMKIVEKTNDPFHDEVTAELDAECRAILDQYAEAEHYKEQARAIPESLRQSFLHDSNCGEFDLN